MLIDFEEKYLTAAAELYRQVYLPGVDSPETILAAVTNHIERESFIGILAVNDEEQVIGLVWGYEPPFDDSRRTQLIIKKLGVRWVRQTFVIEAFAVAPDEKEPRPLHEQLINNLIQRVHAKAYKRIRLRLDLPRQNPILQTLQQSAWGELQRLEHVIWLGKRL